MGCVAVGSFSPADAGVARHLARQLRDAPLGGRRFETGDDSRNSWWVALLTFGEGWHNNHHAHPTSARHGLRWYEIDLNWLGIRALQFLGLAHGIKRLRFNRVSSAWQPISARVKSEGS